MHKSYLLANAPTLATITLLIEIVIVLGLTFGAWLARCGRYRLHAWCQSVVALCNVVVIAIAMAPSFQSRVSPKLPERWGSSFHSLATAHAVLGSVAELGALYLVLAAGTKILPERLGLTNLKVGMRCVLAVWWIALLLGVATYVRWYVPLRQIVH